MSSLKLKHLLFLLVLLAACVLRLSEARAPKRRPPPPKRPPPPARRPPPPTPTPPPSHPPPPPPSSPAPRSFMLALTWPNAYCNEPVPCISVVGLKQHFTIHGLWPMSEHGNAMRNCKAQALTDQTFKDFKVVLRNDLMEYWPKVGNEKSFYAGAGSWKTQWTYHGSCSTFSPEVYFEKATALAKVHGKKVLESLATDNIKPDGTTQHSSTKVLAAIEKGTRKNAVLSCSQDKNGKLQLSEVRLCFNAKAETLEDCTGRSPTCNKDFIFASKPPPPPPPPPRYPSTHNTPSLGLTSFMLDVEEAAKF